MNVMLGYNNILTLEKS